MCNTRVLWITIALYGSFIHLFVEPANVARTSAKTNQPAQNNTTISSEITQASAEDTSLPFSSSSTTSTTGAATTTTTSSSSTSTTTTTPSPSTTPTTPSTTASTSTPLTSSSTTNPFSSSTFSTASTVPSTTATSVCPDIFANQEPGYYTVTASPIYTGNENEVAGSGMQAPNNNAGDVMVITKPVMVMKMAPVPMQASYVDGGANGYSGVNQAPQSQQYVVVDQYPGREVDYYHVNPADNAGNPTNNANPTNIANSYDNGNPSYNANPAYNVKPFYNANPYPSYNPNFVYYGNPMYYANPMNNGNPTYNANGFSGTEGNLQPPPSAVMQPPYYDDVILAVPPPMPNMTLSEPDVRIVKQNIGNNTVTNAA